LALATYGFGILLEQSSTTPTHVRPTTAASPPPARRDHLGLALFSDKGFYYLLLAFVVLTVVIIQAILRGRMGRLLKGLSDSPVASRPTGDGQRHEGAGLLHLGRLAAIAGALLASLFSYGLGTNYSSFASLTCGHLDHHRRRRPLYAILAAVAYASSRATSPWPTSAPTSKSSSASRPPPSRSRPTGPARARRGAQLLGPPGGPGPRGGPKRDRGRAPGDPGRPSEIASAHHDRELAARTSVPASPRPG